MFNTQNRQNNKSYSDIDPNKQYFIAFNVFFYNEIQFYLELNPITNITKY